MPLTFILHFKTSFVTGWETAVPFCKRIFYKEKMTVHNGTNASTILYYIAKVGEIGGD